MKMVFLNKRKRKNKKSLEYKKIWLDKRGWIKIVEASISILIIVSILLLIATRNIPLPEEMSSRVYSVQNSILREIQLDNSLRESIILIEDGMLPLNSDDSDFPGELVEKISRIEPNYLSCVPKICSPEQECNLEDSKKEVNNEIYSQEVIITSFISETQTEFNPRKLKLFCWVR